ncbi:zmpB, partial [Symbiodinium necroappetens]
KFCRVQAWRIRNLVTMLVRIIKLPHRPSEEGIRNIYQMLDIPIPPGRSSDSLGSHCEAGDDAEDEDLLAEEAGESERATDDEIDEDLLCPEAPSEGAGAVEHSPCLVETPSPRVPPSQSPASEAKNTPPQSKQQILQHLEQCQKTLQALLEAKQQRQAGKQELQMLSRNVETQDTLPMEPAAIDEAVEVAKEQILKAERLQLRSASDRKRKDLDGSCAWMRKGGESDVDKTGMGGCATGVAVSEQPAHDASHKHAETHPIKAIKKEPPSVPIKREPQESQEAPPKEKELPAMPIKREPQESQVVPRNEKELPAMPIKKEPQEEPMKPEHKEPQKKMHDDADASMDPKQVKPAALTPEPNAGKQAALVPSDPPPAKPSLLQNALVLSPAEQKKMANATAKSKYAPGSKKKKADADEDAEEEQEKQAQVKRKPGRPKGKAAPKTPSSPKAKASPKKAAATEAVKQTQQPPRPKQSAKQPPKPKQSVKQPPRPKRSAKQPPKPKQSVKQPPR